MLGVGHMNKGMFGLTDGWMGNVSNNYISIIFSKQKSSNAFDEFAHGSTLQNLQQLLLILVS